MRKTTFIVGCCMIMLRFVCYIRCNIVDNIKLKISRVVDDSYSLLLPGDEEQVGHNLTLNCDFFSSDNTSYDDRMAWGKALPDFLFKNESDLETYAKKKSPQLFAYFSQPTQQLNRVVKTFTPLKDSDAGIYFCGTLKYMKFKIVNIVVKSNGNLSPAIVNYNKKKSDFYCNDIMFKCKTSGACIPQHYACDKKPDCMDGSDESVETCKGDPCQNKLECDGRCIPTDWCCDRHLDPNCTVEYRPSCCQLYTSTYDESEYFAPNNMTQPVRQNNNRFLFITLCILATFFSMLLMLLILSKICLLAKKARCRDANAIEQMYLDDCAHHLHRAVAVRSSHSPMIRNYNYVCHLPAADVNDALLVLSDDILRRGSVEVRLGGADERPPSYTDVMSLEPPPPYTSQDCLNRNN